jgi:eukaryotic-like serine/threonine-protein kinase
MAKILPAQSRVGSYVIERQIGVGGMGAVYAARSADGVEVALKLLHADAATEEDARKRFLREAKATMALDHDNIVKMVETFEHEGQPVIAMELLRGSPLSRVIESKGKLSLPEAARIFLRVVSAVGSAHALGLVHRDLKPDNVLVLEGPPWVKVLDFGIAKIRKGYSLEESSALTRTGMLVGTPYYMSPEQAFGDKSIDHRADLWSLGLMLYEALTGTLLTRAPTLHEVFTKLLSGPFPRLDQVDPSIPHDVADLVHRMLSRERAERPVDLREVFVVLSRFAGEVDDEPTSFTAAVAPISFDSPSVPSPQPGAGTELLPSPASPVHLTPRSISSDTGRRTPDGTVVIDREPEGVAPPPAAPTPASGYLDATVHLPKKSGAWMWVVALLIAAVCVAVLVRELL